MNAIHRKRGKCKLIQQQFYIFPSSSGKKSTFPALGSTLLEVAAATSLVHLAKFGGCNNLPFPIDTRYVRIILETHFKQRNPPIETGVEDK